jgi:hypothetical protein
MNRFFVAAFASVIGVLLLATPQTLLAGTGTTSPSPRVSPTVSAAAKSEADSCTAVKPEDAITGTGLPTGGDRTTYVNLAKALQGTSCSICVNQGSRVLLPYGIQGSGGQNSFWCFVTGVLNYNAMFINLIAIGWVAWFGMQYALAMGNASQQKAAKEAIIGILVGVIFITLTRFLLTILGGPANVG